MSSILGSASSPLRVVDALLKVALLPSQTSQPFDAVQGQINNILFRYNEDLQGVPVLYYSLSFKEDSKCGRILDELPWINVDAVTKLLVFQPRIHQTLVGCINKVPCISLIRLMLYLTY
jgi:hypothetical protein